MCGFFSSVNSDHPKYARTRLARSFALAATVGTAKKRHFRTQDYSSLDSARIAAWHAVSITIPLPRHAPLQPLRPWGAAARAFGGNIAHWQQGERKKVTFWKTFFTRSVEVGFVLCYIDVNIIAKIDSRTEPDNEIR
jgi:hypothetical protein